MSRPLYQNVVKFIGTMESRKGETYMDNYTDDMTLEEQIGQTLMVGFWGDTPSQEIINLIQQHHIGNIILFSRNVRDAQQVLELTQRLQMYAKEARQPY